MKYETLQAMVKTMFDDIKVVENKKLVLVIGNTGDGKSALVNYLAGSHLISKEIEKHEEIRMRNGTTTKRTTQNRVVVVAPGETEHTRIGHEVSSETLHPKVVEASQNDFYYCDCPGFLDNRGRDERLCAVLGTQLAIEFSKSIKAILVVVDFKKLEADNKGDYLQTLVATVMSLIGTDLEICNKSLYFIVTKERAFENNTYNKVIDGLYKLKNHIDGLLDYHPENLDLERKSTLLEWLILNAATNILIGDVLDNGECKANIVNRLIDSQPIEKKAFITASGNSPDKVTFNEMMSSIADDGLKLVSDLLDKPIEIEKEKKIKTIEESFINKKNEELLHLDEKFKESQAVKEFINEADRLIKDHREMLLDKNDARIKIIIEMQSMEKQIHNLLNEGEQPVSAYWVDTYDERNVYDSVYKGVENTKRFVYSNVPFSHVRQKCHLGTFEEITVSPNEGNFVGEYKTDRNIYGSCTVSIDILKKNQLDFKSTLEATKAKQGSLHLKITEIEDQIRIIEKDKRDCENRKLDAKSRNIENVEELRKKLSDQIYQDIRSTEERVKSHQHNIEEMTATLKLVKQRFTKQVPLFNMVEKICSFIRIDTDLIKKFNQKYNVLKQGNPELFIISNLTKDDVSSYVDEENGAYSNQQHITPPGEVPSSVFPVPSAPPPEINPYFTGVGRRSTSNFFGTEPTDVQEEQNQLSTSLQNHLMP
ncbi:MAG: GTPase [Nitrososphaerales archaeon]